MDILDFPYPIYEEKILNRDLTNLINTSNINNYGLKIIKNYHPSIWHCNIKGKISPYEAWFNKDIINRCIENRLKYKGNNINKSNLLYGLNVSKLAPKISVFRPSLAKYLIKKYLYNYNSIFDPCSGFSGRLLGAYSLNKLYIGQDINNNTVKESNNIIKKYNINASITCKNSLNNKGNYECLFTCPPYGDKENWNQSIEILNCDEWIDILINNYKCKSYLFVVDNTIKYKSNIVETINNISHLSKTKEYVILIT